MKLDKKVLALIIILTLVVALFTVFVIVSSGPDDDDEDTADVSGYYYVDMIIQDYGTVKLKLDANAAPITVANFVKLVNEGFYNGLTFHRVISGFMIQGGDPKGNGMGGSDKTIFGEFSANGYDNPIKHEKGVISMARRGDDYNSATSQFFICNATNSSVSNLDGQYAAFGYVIEGIELIDLITYETAPGYNNGVITNPAYRAVITEMKVVSHEEG